MPEPTLSIRGLRKRFGAVAAIDGLDLDIGESEFHAVIGPNGAGKTTLLNLMSGLLAADAGSIMLDGLDITGLPVHRRAKLGLARSFQVTSVLPSMSTAENVELAAQAKVRERRAIVGRSMAALERVGIAGRADLLAGRLSHGEKRALELAMALAGEPKVLLLDEPLAGAGYEEATRIIEVLRELKGSFPIVLVEHDMDAVFALADRVSVLLYGRVLASGAPEAVRADPRVVEAYLGDEME